MNSTNDRKITFQKIKEKIKEHYLDIYVWLEKQKDIRKTNLLDSKSQQKIKPYFIEVVMTSIIKKDKQFTQEKYTRECHSLLVWKLWKQNTCTLMVHFIVHPIVINKF